MEATKFAMHGSCNNPAGNTVGIKLPIGYRFHPTDEELVFHYLRPKVFGIPLPASVIPEFDVFLTTPLDLPGDVKEKRYFFCKNNNQGNLVNKSCKIGYWKPIGKPKHIVSWSNKAVLATRKTLVFKQGKRSSHGSKTRWLMHKYELLHPQGKTQYSNQTLPSNTALEDWAVYCVFQRKRRPLKNTKATTQSSKYNNSCNIREFMVQGRSDMCCSSSCSSAVTEDSTNALDQEASSANYAAGLSSYSYIRMF